MKITSLIIDDHPLNITVLADLLSENHPEIQLLDIAENGRMAIEKIQSLKPDLIFLDIEMPDMNGFEVLASLDLIEFQTIFVTTHSHYAIKAIRFNALDYLVKPLDPAELKHAIARYHSNKKDLTQLKIQNALDNFKKDVLDQVLFLPTQEGGISMTLRDIVVIQGDRNYSTFHLSSNQTKVSSKTLGHFEEILDDKGFFRCHRSFIVNRHYVVKLQNGGFVLKDTTSIPISRRRKKEAMAWFGS